jgi:hypothetical protein
MYVYMYIYAQHTHRHTNTVCAARYWAAKVVGKNEVVGVVVGGGKTSGGWAWGEER